MLKNLTKDLTTAVHSTIPVITNIASSPDSLLQDVSQIISSNTSKIISNTTPLETINTISSHISSPLTTITNTTPLETINTISSNISTPLTTITNITPFETINSISSQISSPLTTIINTTPLETFNTISSHISSPLITIKNTNPLETIKTISSHISSPFTTITNSLVNPLNNQVNPISLVTSFLGKVQQLVLGSTQITFSPLWLFRFTLILVLAGLISSIFMPFIILTSPIWIPTATLFLLFTAMFLSVCGFVVSMLAIIFQAYRYYMRRHPHSK